MILRTKLRYERPKLRRPADPLGFCAPYETEPSATGANDRRAIPHQFGGYGVLDGSGTLTGPYSFYENALDRSAFHIGGIVVRWADFVKSTLMQSAFQRRVSQLKEPMIVKVRGLGKPVSI